MTPANYPGFAGRFLVELLETLLALEAADITQGQAECLIPGKDAADLREMAQHAKARVQARWDAYRAANPPHPLTGETP